jgi:hypothetical protein
MLSNVAAHTAQQLAGVGAGGLHQQSDSWDATGLLLHMTENLSFDAAYPQLQASGKCV